MEAPNQPLWSRMKKKQRFFLFFFFSGVKMELMEEMQMNLTIHASLLIN